MDTETDPSVLPTKSKELSEYSDVEIAEEFIRRLTTFADAQGEDYILERDDTVGDSTRGVDSLELKTISRYNFVDFRLKFDPNGKLNAAVSY
jgi:hypothetical protein